MTGALRFTVVGIPAPQGSKRFVGFKKKLGSADPMGRGLMIESSRKVAPWREAVANAAVAARNGAPALDGPLVLTVTFWLPRPASASKKKIAMGPCRKPDLSKLVRSTEDALTTSGAIADDARIVKIVAAKVYMPEGGHAGAEIEVASAE